ncbi:MAG: hypothetical protein WC785_05305 [Tatlockia sp.]|jgi:hypothetical protein
MKTLITLRCIKATNESKEPKVALMQRSVIKVFIAAVAKHSRFIDCFESAIEEYCTSLIVVVQP